MTETYSFSSHEEVCFEFGELTPDGGTCHLVTALRRETWRSGLVRESHVFMCGTGVHLHEIEYACVDEHDEPDVTTRACEATRALLIAHLQQSGSPDANAHPRGLVISLRRTLESPFHRFQQQGLFASALRSIQGWTTSRSLQTSLKQLTPRRLAALAVERLATAAGQT